MYNQTPYARPGYGVPPPGYNYGVPPPGYGYGAPPGYPPTGLPGANVQYNQPGYGQSAPNPALMRMRQMQDRNRTMIASLPKQKPYDMVRERRLLSINLRDEKTVVCVKNISYGLVLYVDCRTTISNKAMQRILECCGHVSSWKRAQANGILASFGLCEYESAEGAVRAINVLDGVALADKNLAVVSKDKSKIQEYIKKRQPHIDARKQVTNDPHPFDELEARDKLAEDTVNQLLSIYNTSYRSGGGAGLVSLQERSVRERKAKKEKERKERENRIEEQRKRLLLKAEDRQYRKAKQRDAQFRRLERKWLDHEADSRDKRRRRKYELSDKLERRKRYIEVDSEDAKSHRRKIRSRRAKQDREREYNFDLEEEEKERAKIEEQTSNEKMDIEPEPEPEPEEEKEPGQL